MFELNPSERPIDNTNGPEPCSTSTLRLQRALGFPISEFPCGAPTVQPTKTSARVSSPLPTAQPSCRAIAEVDHHATHISQVVYHGTATRGRWSRDYVRQTAPASFLVATSGVGPNWRLNTAAVTDPLSCCFTLCGLRPRGVSVF